jgi:hypothetical protein
MRQLANDAVSERQQRMDTTCQVLDQVLIYERNWIADTDSSTPNMGENIDTTPKKTQKLY